MDEVRSGLTPRFRFRVNATSQANRGQSWSQRRAANTAEAIPGCWLHLGYINVPGAPI
jgi:hypothetical protein